jgi:hypothetical protein
MHAAWRVQEERLRGLAVSGEEVHAYAALAASTASQHVWPVSKQENLGPRRIERHGWGGGLPLLEALSRSLRRA